ncbi:MULTISPECIES: FG-GAP and VCBS repeat-containing protein [unclassified Streptomyces]|uniref:FG-GAP and VCBS repeat-containing protein n=1 Tax=unclassified Streptomyces TaxID=2593676 RepID=UPI0022551FFD|nr:MULTISPECIES: FG-GAP and VCBS repeat-containing protein [unclassified Streptomyces]MCX4989587.1 FG-GAP-like repeat-containing protein [Streptomyces sp. NBC_00568]MCX5005173.1 FG-GAP-like repeat-containing protein [Streptomyces sp. NBC_00638]
MRNRTLLLTAALTTGLLTAQPATPAAAAPAPYADDFNGDGYRDLVVGAPDAIVSGKWGAGAVVVLYGSAAGPGKAGKQLISQNTAGVEGAAETNDAFGSSVASADLDADGYADLLVGAPYEDVPGAQTRGSVTVVWGGARGLRNSAVLPAPSPYEDGDAGGCSYGTGVAAVNPKAAPGRPVVSVAGWCAGIGLTGPFTRSGKPVGMYLKMDTPSLDDVALGDLRRTGHPDDIDISVGLSDHPSGGVYINASGPSEPLPTDGDNVAVGDVDGDGYGDLVVGDPSDTVIDGTPQEGTGHKGGQIAVWRGGPNGIGAAAEPILIHQDTPGVPGAAENNDSFGADVSVADVNGDGYGDIAVGVPGENLGSLRDAGSVIVVPGRAGGPTGAGSTSISQDSAAVPGTAERGDTFGRTVRLADLTKDGRPDLVVGASGENNDTGGIWVFKGSATGPATKNSYSVMGTAVGLPAEHFTNWASVLAP